MQPQAKTIVFKVGTSTLTHATGKTNLKAMDELVTVLADLRNAGWQVVPVGQLLITKEDMDDSQRRANLDQAFQKLFSYGAIPIINENDAVAVDEIVYGDNDSLSAEVAALLHASALIILAEVDGLYTANPTEDPTARRIAEVPEITDTIRACASGHGTALGTGGMVTKLHAAEIATRAGVETYVVGNRDFHDIYRLLDGESVGTHFFAKENSHA